MTTETVWPARDLVNNPPHYKQGGLEVIEILRKKLSKEEFQGACKAQIIQYLLRAPHKGTEVMDYQKAAWWAAELAKYAEDNTGVG